MPESGHQIPSQVSHSRGKMTETTANRTRRLNEYETSDCQSVWTDSPCSRSEQSPTSVGTVPSRFSEWHRHPLTRSFLRAGSVTRPGKTDPWAPVECGKGLSLLYPQPLRRFPEVRGLGVAAGRGCKSDHRPESCEGRGPEGGGATHPHGERRLALSRRPAHGAVEACLINSLNTEVYKFYTLKENTLL